MTGYVGSSYPNGAFRGHSNGIDDTPTPTASDLAKHLGGRRVGKHWQAHCPAPMSSNPSLTISEGDDGLVLVHCKSGCAQSDVLVALRTRGLWPERKRVRHALRKIAACYDYRDEYGHVLYQTLRYVPKDFSQRRPDGRRLRQ